jgi:hypothetical protein
VASETYQAPSIEYIRELLDHVQSYWRTQTDFDKERLEMYWDEDKVVQENTAARGRRRRVQPERMTSNELRRQVDLIVSLFPYPSEIGVEPVGEGSRSESRAESLELGLNEAIDQLNPPLDSPLLRGRWSMCLLGREARMIVPGHMYWWDFPELTDEETLDEWSSRYGQWASRAPIPVVWADLPAESTFPPSFGRMDEELVSWQTVTGYDLCTMFSPSELSGMVKREPEGYKAEYTLVIFSNQAHLAYGVVNEKAERPQEVQKLIRTIEHGLGVPAIQILPGTTSGRKEPAKYWQGVSDSSMALIKAANRRLSEASTASKFDALPMMKQWLQDNPTVGEGASSEEQQVLSGDIIPLKVGAEGMDKEDIQPLFQPRFGDKTMSVGLLALNRAERLSGAVEALEGATGPSGEPAWSRNSIIEQSKMKHSRLAQAVSAADVAAADMISRCIRVFGEDVTITPRRSKGPQIVLRPKDLEYYRATLKAEYKMQLPVSRRADLQLGVSMMEQSRRAGLPISPAYVMEQVMDISRPFEEFKRSITWDLLLSEESKAFYRKLLIKESEMDLADEEGMGLEELAGLVQAGQLDPNMAQQLAQLGTGQGPAAGLGANSQLGNRGDRRAGIPFSTSPTGPQPEQEIPPVGAY